MKSATTFVSALFTATLFAATPVIDDSSVSVRQLPNRTVLIEYTMNPAAVGDNEPAIVTVDILTNSVSVGGERLWTLSGDVNKLVSHTQDHKHKILWKPTKEGFPEFNLPAASVTARISLWSTNAPPNYWVINLDTPSDRAADRYYPDAEQIPGTVTNQLYKTERLVFRRIPAEGVTWKMGGSESYGYTTYHYVTFSYDYWMSVFEMTRAQLHALAWAYPAPAASNVALPAVDDNDQTLTITAIRGNPSGTSQYNWPSNGHDKVAWRMNDMRSSLHGIPVDLPTEAEWEFACRAGSSTAYCNGDAKDDLDKVGWYSGNSGGALHDVGLKMPNAWGIYDMHGNAREWCLDKYSKRTADPVWDPTGPMQDDMVVASSDIVAPGNLTSRAPCVVRGGARSSSANDCRSWAISNDCYPSYSPTINGFRLAVPLK